MLKILKNNSSAWNEKFGWFWMNDYEIFDASDADLEKKILAFRTVGINHLITFSCTHFRWNFIDSFDKINRVLLRLCDIAHKHSMRVTEHHSSHLTFKPVDDQSLQYMKNVLKKRQCCIDNWPGLMENATGDPAINGSKLSSFRQIDGQTGKAVYTMYNGCAMCFNNPNFVREYLQYLESIYRCGVDGIMTDDVQYFGESCACGYCREKFRKFSGLDLPEAGEDWEKWFGNYHDLSFIRWLEFRADSLTEFHKNIKKHYESLNLRLLRPWYRSQALSHSLLNYYLETLPALDWVFQEACYSSIIRYSWVGYAIEQKHRVSVARQRRIPSMLMFYPDRQDSMDFTWGLCRSWASIFLATCEGKEGTCSEKEIREFEAKYACFLDDLDNIATVGFYDTYMNRLKSFNFNKGRMISWLQSCILSNVPCDLFSENEFIRMKNYSVVIAVDHEVLTEKEIIKLKNHAASGAILMISESSGSFNENMHEFNGKEWRERWGLAAFDGAVPDGFNKIPAGRGQIVVVGTPFMNFAKALECASPRLSKEDEGVVCEIDFTAAKKNSASFRNFLMKLDTDCVILELTGFDTELSATIHCTQKGEIILQVVNVGGTLCQPESLKLSHADRIPFPQPGKGEICLKKKNLRKVSKVKLVALSAFLQERDVQFREDGNSLSMMIPDNSFNRYALIVITLSDNP